MRGKMRYPFSSANPPPPHLPEREQALTQPWHLQQSGTEFQRTKEQQAAIMRQKQAEGKWGVANERDLYTVLAI